jgi:vancomycin resistance protein YoaR
MRFVRRRGLVAFVLGGGALLLMAAYAITVRANSGHVAPRVELAGSHIGGMNRAELNRTLDRLAGQYEGAEVEIKTPEGGFTADAATMGLHVDRDATVRRALRIGRGGLPVTRLWSWAYSFLKPRTATIALRVDRAEVLQIIADQDQGPNTPAVEPTIKFAGDHFVGVPGKKGRGINPDDIAAELAIAAGDGKKIVVAVERKELDPHTTMEEAKRVAAEADRLVRGPVTLTVGGQETVAALADLRNWATAVLEPGGRLRFAIDGERAAAELKRRFPRAGTPAAETVFKVVGTQVTVVPGHAGTACCDPVIGAHVEDVLRGRGQQPADAPLRHIEPKISAEKAASLGIKEVVGSFTTNHPPGQPRVLNIHRIADMMRGQVILPNTTMSINAVVGPRTAGKGFVSAPVIQEGVFAEDIGGGVSQFATTLFNAAFFAGLEFPEYMAHTIYISRYPYGREATLNHPHPDLRIRNTTPYGVLVWPSYSATGVTVTLYSTKTWTSTQTGQTKTPFGLCTKVRTERTRVRLADKSTKVDAVFANYRPEEGVECDGRRTGPSSSTTVAATTTTTTIKKPAATTTVKPPPTSGPPPATTTTAHP